MTEIQATELYNLIFAIGCLVLFVLGSINGSQR